jgi:hypothetical protein
MPTNVDFIEWLDTIANPAGADAAAVVAGAGSEAAAAATGLKGLFARLRGMIAKQAGGGLKTAGILGGAALGGSLYADFFRGRLEEKRSWERKELALEDPEAYKASVMRGMEDEAIASAIEATRMRKLQLGLGVQNPQMLKVLQALAAGDAFPRLGPGEHIAGGSSIMDPEVVNRAIATGDMGEELDRIRLGG